MHPDNKLLSQISNGSSTISKDGSNKTASTAVTSLDGSLGVMSSGSSSPIRRGSAESMNTVRISNKGEEGGGGGDEAGGGESDDKASQIQTMLKSLEEQLSDDNDIMSARTQTLHLKSLREFEKESGNSSSRKKISSNNNNNSSDDDTRPSSKTLSMICNSSGGGDSDDDGLLDISWGSNNCDKAKVMNSLEDVLLANPHMKLLEEEEDTNCSSIDQHRGDNNVSSGLSLAAALMNYDADDIKGGQDGRSGLGSEGGGGAVLTVSATDTSLSGSTSYKSKARMMAPQNAITQHDNDGDGTMMIPPVFRPRRHSSITSGASSGGGGLSPMVAGAGAGGGGGGRGVNNSGTSQPLGILRNNKSGSAMGPIVHVDGGGDGGSEFVSKTLGFKDRSNRSSRDGKNSGLLGTLTSAVSGGGWTSRRRASEDSKSSMSSLESGRDPQRRRPHMADLSHRSLLELSDSSHEILAVPQGEKSKRSVSLIPNTGSSSGAGDDRSMDLSVEHLSSSMRPGGGSSTRGGGSNGDDTALVAVVGGTAYLKASKKVWAMRIIVIATFVVVSIIVTVLIYTFFRNLENDTLTNEFAMLAVSLTRNVIELMERKTYSLGVLANNYEGILGEQTNITAPPGDHAPSVMLSDQAEATCTPFTSNNKWKTQLPYVTLPGYESYSESMMSVSEDRAVFFAPVVPEENVSVWENYAKEKALDLAIGAVTGGIRTPSGDIVQYDLHELSGHLSGGDRVLGKWLRRGLASQEAQPHSLIDSVNTSTLEDGGGSLSVRVPIWQLSPFNLSDEGLMWDMYKHPPYTESLDRILQAQSEIAATKIIPCNDLLIPFHLTDPPSPKLHHHVVMEYSDGTSTRGYVDHIAHGHFDLIQGEAGGQLPYGVCSTIFAPVHSSSAHGSNSSIVMGVVASVFSWMDILRASANAINRSTGRRYVTPDVFVVVTSRLIEATHFESYQSAPATYYVAENDTEFHGMGRNIQQQHASMVLKYDFKVPLCNVVYSFEVYPTDALYTSYGKSNTPMFLALIACFFVVLSTLVFFVYDYFVNYRQKVIIQQAARSTRIVHSLYPAFVRDNLFKSDVKNDGKTSRRVSTDDLDFDEGPQYSSNDAGTKRKLKLKVSDLVDTPANQLKRFLSHPSPGKSYDLNMAPELDVMDPIAEVFENTTVMIADIEGFTAWCSEREPSQVFRLLETVYRAFDLEGSKAGVFKVETVGDSYVAVTGLPDPREDHAVLIAKYAIKCLLKFNVLAKRLEPTLGPGTASLGMRFGLHSGPVTAGVLRGEKSRFQLFGDTINVASRMESTGEKNMIQVSQDTAALLKSAGKGHWLVPRDNPVSAKGKGLVQTYWLQPNKRRPSMNSASMQSSQTSISSEGISSLGEEEDASRSQVHRALSRSWRNINIENGASIAKERLIRWNAAILESFLLKILEQRNSKDGGDPMTPQLVYEFTPSQDDKLLSFSEKLCEKIMFPDDSYSEEYPIVLVGTSISSQARAQLLEYVSTIASMYRDVPFHNFDHASHVTMSANKLLNRVCTAFVSEDEDFASVAARTFGISADPLAQFVIVFSSLVHDVDHQGVPNAQLVKEHDPLCDKYDNKSVAEKRSIAVAWEILMEDRFHDLQGVIFTNSREMIRFRQLLMNTVLATDIADKERSAAGKIRWQKAFHPSDSDVLDASERQENIRSLKATLVFEQIMQASDVSHTMQHWHTFKKWNKRLYTELSKAYREGRGAADPRTNWYEGEIGFFDFYIIPLAKKLRECGVFGSAASEYLDYAVENRRRWEEEGKEIANNMINDNELLEEQLEDLESEDEKDVSYTSRGSRSGRGKGDVHNNALGNSISSSGDESPLDESSSPKEEVLSALGNSVNSSSGNESTLDDSSLKVDGLV